MTTAPLSPTARWSAVAGGLALALAIGAGVVSFVLSPGAALQLLTIATWAVAALGILGLVLGLMAGMAGEGRQGVLMSASALVLLGLFLAYSSFAAPVAVPAAVPGATPAAPAAPASN